MSNATGLFRPRPTSSRDLGVIVAAICCALAGCASAPRQPAAPERTSEAPNAIDVKMVKRVLTVHFTDGSLAPAPGQVEALNVLLASGDVGQGDRVLIEGAAGPFGEARAHALASALSREGLKTTVSPRPSWPVDEERLVIEHAVATVPGCPNWSDTPGE